MWLGSRQTPDLSRLNIPRARKGGAAPVAASEAPLPPPAATDAAPVEGPPVATEPKVRLNCHRPPKPGRAAGAARRGGGVRQDDGIAVEHVNVLEHGRN